MKLGNYALNTRSNINDPFSLQANLLHAEKVSEDCVRNLKVTYTRNNLKFYMHHTIQHKHISSVWGLLVSNFIMSWATILTESFHGFTQLVWSNCHICTFLPKYLQTKNQDHTQTCKYWIILANNAMPLNHIEIMNFFWVVSINFW